MAEQSTYDKAKDFLFGKKVLEQAAGTAKAPPAGAQDTTELKKHIDRYMAEEAARKAAAKPAPAQALQELAKPTPKKTVRPGPPQMVGGKVTQPKY